MKESSLQNSPDTKEINKKLEVSILARDHILRRSEFIEHELQQLISQKDPYVRHITQYSKKCRQIQLLKQQVTSLKQQITQLQDKLKNNQENVAQKISQKGSQNSQKLSNHSMDVQQNQSSSSSSKLQNQMQRAGYTTEAKVYKNIQSAHQIARQQNLTQQKYLQKLDSFLAVLINHLIIKIEFAMYSKEANTQNNINSQKKAKGDQILVSRQKFRSLVQFYAGVMIQRKIQKINYQRQHPQKSQNQNDLQNINLKPSNLMETIQKNQQSNLPSKESLQYLEALFKSLANYAGLSQQWTNFMIKNKEYSIIFRQQIQMIANGGKGIKQNQKYIKDLQLNIQIAEKNKSFINETLTSLGQQNSLSINGKKVTCLEVSYNMMQSANGFIQDQLFDKIQKIIKKLSFKKKEIQIYEEWNNKRKLKRTFGYDREFIQDFDKQFQNQYQHLQEAEHNRSQQVAKIRREYTSHIQLLSKQYSVCLIKTLNFTIAKLSQWILQNQNNPQVNGWLNSSIIQPILKNSQRIQQPLYEQIITTSRQFILSLVSSKDKKKQNNGSKDTSKFDNQKQLENRICSIVQGHLKILKGQFLIHNNKINLKHN